MSGIPVAASEIDPDWLTEILTPRHPGVRVAGLRIADRHEATNAHALLEVEYHEAAGAPSRLFCKLLPGDPQMRPLVAATGMGRREALFYEQLAPGLELRTPRVHGVRRAADGEDFVLLLEDIVASGCTVSDGTTGVDPDAAAVALEELAAMHLRYAEPGRRAAEAGWVQGPLHDPAYAGGMLRVGLDQHRERLSDAFADVAGLYLERADAMHALWQQGPTTVIHGDTHVGNLFFDAGRVGFLDWGIISTGTPLRDVSYFLTMAMGIDERRAHERDLLRHHLAAWNAGGGEPIDFDAAWRGHRLHAAYTVVASCQVVLFPEGVSPARQRFADAFLARAEAAVADLESAAALRATL